MKIQWSSYANDGNFMKIVESRRGRRTVTRRCDIFYDFSYAEKRQLDQFFDKIPTWSKDAGVSLSNTPAGRGMRMRI